MSATLDIIMSEGLDATFLRRSASDRIEKDWWIAKDLAPISTKTLLHQEKATNPPVRFSAAVLRPSPIGRSFSEVRPRTKWLGHVTEVSDDGFVAMFQTEEGDRKAIIAEFDQEELAPDDLDILKEGSPIVWAIFTERERGGLKNSSLLYIRRITPPNESVIESVEEELNEWFGNLTDDTPGDERD